MGKMEKRRKWGVRGKKFFWRLMEYQEIEDLRKMEGWKIWWRMEEMENLGWWRVENSLENQEDGVSEMMGRWKIRGELKRWRIWDGEELKIRWRIKEMENLGWWRVENSLENQEDGESEMIESWKIRWESRRWSIWDDGEVKNSWRIKEMENLGWWRVENSWENQEDGVSGMIGRWKIRGELKKTVKYAYYWVQCMILGLYHVFTGSTGRYKVSLWYYRKLQEELRTQLVASPHTTGDILRLRWHLTQPERPMNYLKDSLLGRPRDVHGSVHTYRLFPGNLLNRGQQMDNEKNS